MIKFLCSIATLSGGGVCVSMESGDVELLLSAVFKMIFQTLKPKAKHMTSLVPSSSHPSSYLAAVEKKRLRDKSWGGKDWERG